MRLLPYIEFICMIILLTQVVLPLCLGGNLFWLFRGKPVVNPAEKPPEDQDENQQPPRVNPLN